MLAQRRFRLILPLAIAAGLALTTNALGPIASSSASPQQTRVSGHAAVTRLAGRKPDLRNPPRNQLPSKKFVHACRHVKPSIKSQTRCDKASLRSFDRARSFEDMPPMVLPSEFPRLSPPLQVLAITNIERVDRGLRPAVGLTTSLDKEAQKGADSDSDPPFPARLHGTSATSNWAGTGSSVLLADFVWMYDDGPGSINVDCQSAGDADCWGHRDNVLGNYGTPLKLGAAFHKDSAYGGSIAAEWCGGDTHDRVLAPNWSAIAPTIPVGIQPRSLRIRKRGGTSEVLLFASGRTFDVALTIVGDPREWSVSPRRCRLRAGGECVPTVTFDPSSKRGPHTATLVISGPNTTRRIGLHG